MNFIFTAAQSGAALLNTPPGRVVLAAVAATGPAIIHAYRDVTRGVKQESESEKNEITRYENLILEINNKIDTLENENEELEKTISELSAKLSELKAQESMYENSNSRIIKCLKHKLERLNRNEASIKALNEEIELITQETDTNRMRGPQ